MRNTKELEASETYLRHYANMTDYFALDINGGKPVKNFSNPAAPVAPVQHKAVVVQTVNAAGAKGKTMEVEADACACGKTGSAKGSCGCGGKGAESKGDSCGCGPKGAEASGESCGCGSGSCGC